MSPLNQKLLLLFLLHRLFLCLFSCPTLHPVVVPLVYRQRQREEVDAEFPVIESQIGADVAVVVDAVAVVGEIGGVGRGILLLIQIDFDACVSFWNDRRSRGIRGKIEVLRDEME